MGQIFIFIAIVIHTCRAHRLPYSMANLVFGLISVGMSFMGYAVLPWTFISIFTPRVLLHSMRSMIIMAAFFTSAGGRLWVAEETFHLFTALLSGVLAVLLLFCRADARHIEWAWTSCTVFVFGAGVLWLSAAMFGIPEWRLSIPATEFVVLLLVLLSLLLNLAMRTATKRMSRNTEIIPERDSAFRAEPDEDAIMKRIAIDEYGLNSHDKEGKVAQNAIMLFKQRSV
jgi:hypothetical protein